MAKVLFRSAILVLSLAGSLQAELTCGIDHVAIDGVKIPYGTVVEVVGPWRWYTYMKEDSPAVAGLRINGRANDDDITVELVASKDGWTYSKLRGLDSGRYYKVRGPLMDAYDGPNKKFNIIVEHLEPVDAAPLTFADFADRRVTLEGIAVGGSRLSVGNDQALLEGLAAWPTRAEGKRLAVRGTIRGQPGAWRFENPQWQLLQLADQIDQMVSVEGVLWDSYGKWWFEYREEKGLLDERERPRHGVRLGRSGSASTRDRKTASTRSSIARAP